MVKIKDVFKKQKLTPEEEQEKLKTQIMIYGGIFLAFALFVIFTPSGEGIQDRIKKYNLNNINSLFEKIDDNYNFIVEKSADSGEYELTYNRDGKMIMLEGNALNATGYMIYDNKNYILKNSNIFEVSDIEYVEPIEEYHYDFELLKDFLNKCTLEYKSKVEYSCKLKVSDYIESYNRLNSSSFIVNEDSELDIKLIFYNDIVDKITFDYTQIDKIITGRDISRSIYSVEFQEIGTNDFSQYINYMENNVIKNNN